MDYVALIAFIFLPMGLSVLLFLFYKKERAEKSGLTKTFFVIQFFLMGLLLYLTYIKVIQSDSLNFTVSYWPPSIGIALKIDFINLVFLWMTHVGFWYILLYSWPTKHNDIHYWLLLMFLQSSLNALFVINDVFSMFLLIELTTIICAILILYKKDGPALRAGLYYLLFNTVAITFFLLGIIMLYLQCGSLNLDVLSAQLGQVHPSPYLKISYSFIIAALSLKCGFVPVFSWLPIAHASAPTPISALLSGLIVKIGIFAFIKFNFILTSMHAQQFMLVMALLTAIIGVLLALFQSNIKRILAYHTVSQIGLIAIMLASPSPEAYYGGVFHLVNHFLFKSLLFLVVGFLLEVIKDYNVKHYRALFRLSPLMAAALLLSLLSITGAPLTAGSISKSLLMKASYPFPITGLLYLINLGTFLSFFKYFRTFFGQTQKRLVVSPSTRLAVEGLSLLLILFYPLEILYLKYFTTVDYAFSLFYLGKEFLVYGVYFVIALLFYHYVPFENSKIQHNIARWNLNFPHANFVFMIYLCCIFSIFLFF